MKLYAGLVMAFWLASCSIGAAAPIEHVSVSLSSTEGKIPPILEKRMTASIRAATERIYKGKEETQVQQQVDNYERATADIMNRILYGYTVEHISIIPQRDSQINAVLRPYGDVVQQVEIQMDYGNLSDEAKQLVSLDVGNLQERAEQVLLGAPLDSLDWVEAVVEHGIRQHLENVLPEFIPQVQIKSGKNTTLKVYLIPQGTVVRKGIATVESKTIPSILFYATKRYYDNYLQSFEGLPVNFLGRHDRDVLNEVRALLSQNKAVRKFDVVMEPTIKIGEQIDLTIKAESKGYIIAGDAYLDMGRSNQNTGVRLYTGIHRGKHDFYVETNFHPESYAWRFWPSYGYHITPDTMIGFQFNIKDSERKIWIKQMIKDRWHVRVERKLRNKENELGIAYDVHNYLTLEAITSNHDTWIRVIGHI